VSLFKKIVKKVLKPIEKKVIRPIAKVIPKPIRGPLAAAISPALFMNRAIKKPSVLASVGVKNPAKQQLISGILKTGAIASVGVAFPALALGGIENVLDTGSNVDRGQYPAESFSPAVRWPDAQFGYETPGYYGGYNAYAYGYAPQYGFYGGYAPYDAWNGFRGSGWGNGQAYEARPPYRQPYPLWY